MRNCNSFEKANINKTRVSTIYTDGSESLNEKHSDVFGLKR